jgi:predicted dehydrogenase
MSTLTTDSGTTRRRFLALGAAAAATAASPVFSINAAGANNKVVAGLMGVRNRGLELAGLLSPDIGFDLAWMADPDSRLFRRSAQRAAETRGAEPECVQDFRRMLDNPDIDAIIVATPDHWHALAAILACQAGKHVYVEKPVSHSIWEGRQLVAAAGMQNRSMPCVQAAREHIRSGALGEVHYVRVMNNKARPPLTPSVDGPVPEGVDYDLWLGPAAMRPFSPHHFHYNWHWFWEYSGGDIMNDGVHQLDIVRFLLDLPHPERVYATGGKFSFDDPQETPDTQSVLYDFPGLTLSFEQTLWTRYFKKDPHEIPQLADTPWMHNGTRIEIYGSKEHLILARHGGGWEAFDAAGKSVLTYPSERADGLHVRNFAACIRGEATPAATILEGHRSAALCQYGNIAYRVGRPLRIDPETDFFHDDPEAAGDIIAHRTYRVPWRVPELV